MLQAAAANKMRAANTNNLLYMKNIIWKKKNLKVLRILFVGHPISYPVNHNWAPPGQPGPIPEGKMIYISGALTGLHFPNFMAVVS